MFILLLTFEFVIMLQTEDIDDDYFTPASSTSLANIFGKSRNDLTENESLKYTPPKPSHPNEKVEEQRATQCIFACVLVGYEWSNGAYVTRGKLGFAILNIVKTGAHNIILYDSKKVTLSSATITTSFELALKENSYFSYLDDLQRYWSLYATVDEVNKIIELLKSLNVKIKYLSKGEKAPAELSSLETTSVTKENSDKNLKESDTDSSVNRKTKMSIINRMASMGQSVLPPRVMPAEKSSDSSDTNDSSHYKSVRHKPIKNAKRTSAEKSYAECQAIVEAQKIVPRTEHSTENMPLFTYVDGQLVPVTKTNIITSSSVSSTNDMNYYISEQRMNNSELRININRMTDKLDQVLGKVSNIKSGDNSSSHFQVELLQKLLFEYENKIKVYEEFINKSDANVNITKLFINPALQQSDKDKEANLLKDKIHKLEQLCLERDAKISSLESEMECLKIKYDEVVIKERLKIDKLSQSIHSLDQDLLAKNEEFSNLSNKYEELVSNQCKKEDENDMGIKIKKVMNDIFRAISANFENAESYSGEQVKNVTATVIKRVTIESLCTI